MAELDEEARARARRHTAELLKMLREKTPVPKPEPVLPDTSAEKLQIQLLEAQLLEARRRREARLLEPQLATTVAEAPTSYTTAQDAPPHPPLQDPPPRQRSPQAALTETDINKLPSQRPERTIPTVGESFYQQQGRLGDIMAQVKERVRLKRIFRAYLPPHLQDHAVLIRMDAEEWVVQTDSSSWATRLRYALHNLREILGQELNITLPKAQIRVVPAEIVLRPSLPPPILSEASANIIRAAARTVTDEQLRAALLSLAENAKRSRKPIEDS